MSLRDQLLAKGLVSDKRARQIDRDQKQARKKKQGSKKRKKELQAQEQARQEAERAAAEAERQQRRAEYEDQRARMERALQVRNTILGNLVRSRGNVPFHHLDLEGKRILRMQVSSGLAHQLRCGEAAIVAHRTGLDVEYVVVSRRAAHKLEEIAPRLLVFYTRDTSDLGTPDLDFGKADWEPTLGPRRATEADLRRFGGGSAEAAGV